jgi:hypothetical protein
MESFHSNGVHYIGSSGASGGYSGGPVISNLNGGLAGIVIGAINELGLESSIKDVVAGYYEQKCVKILPITAIEAVYQTGLLTESIAKSSVIV